MFTQTHINLNHFRNWMENWNRIREKFSQQVEFIQHKCLDECNVLQFVLHFVFFFLHCEHTNFTVSIEPEYYYNVEWIYLEIYSEKLFTASSWKVSIFYSVNIFQLSESFSYSFFCTQNVYHIVWVTSRAMCIINMHKLTLSHLILFNVHYIYQRALWIIEFNSGNILQFRLLNITNIIAGILFIEFSL